MTHYSEYLSVAREAALAAGELLRDQALHHQHELVVDATEAHDIKLELDRRCQSLIEQILLRAFPEFAIYGEESISGDPNAEYQWIIDPIDGTVNFFYGIPHFAISIALRHLEKTNTEVKNSLLTKLAAGDEVQGVSGTQTRSVHEGRENTNTGATQQFAAAVELGK
jgi:fructose-1,6-bisphosphatase/inositol monophosphatase family enzyme